MSKIKYYLLIQAFNCLYLKVATSSINQNITNAPIPDVKEKGNSDSHYHPPDYQVGVDSDNLTNVDVSEDRTLDFMGLCEKYGFKCMDYDVITEDGYILKLFNIQGNKQRPVFLLHGACGTADDYILRGRISLGFILAQAGYDVWVGNVRGNRYSRRHVKLNPDTDHSFWKFSMDEEGLIDLPAMIDFVLMKTNQKKLSAVAFSQGTTTFFILGAGKPEYNDKINVFVSLASICFIHKTGAPLIFSSTFMPKLKPMELSVLNTPLQQPLDFLCSGNEIMESLCNTLYDSSIDFLTGSDDIEVEVGFQFVIAGHYPSAISSIVLNHYHQMTVTRRFQHYDFGPVENLVHYKTATVPQYDIRKVTMNTAIMYGNKDRVATKAIAETLKDNLPNVVYYKQVESKHWAHFDFMYGRHAHIYVYKDVQEILQKYSV